MQIYIIEQDGTVDPRLGRGGRGATTTIAEARRVAREVGGYGTIWRIQVKGKAALVDALNVMSGGLSWPHLAAEVAETFGRRPTVERQLIEDSDSYLEEELDELEDDYAW